MLQESALFNFTIYVDIKTRDKVTGLIWLGTRLVAAINWSGLDCGLAARSQVKLKNIKQRE